MPYGDQELNGIGCSAFAMPSMNALHMTSHVDSSITPKIFQTVIGPSCEDLG